MTELLSLNISISTLKFTRVNWKVRTNMNICLFRDFLFKITFLMKCDPFLHRVAQKVHTFIAMCYGMHAFSTELWALWSETLCGSILHFCISLASVAIKMLLERAEKLNISWSFVAAVWMGVSQTATVQSWLGTKCIPSFWPSDEAFWCRFQNGAEVQETVTVVPFAKPRILCWRHKFTEKLWQYMILWYHIVEKYIITVLFSCEKCQFEEEVVE
jgi:hypothetical protein